MTLISETHNQVYQLPVQLPGRKNGRKLVRAITAESIYRCVLLFLDHILYRRAHFVCDALRASRSVLAIKMNSVGSNEHLVNKRSLLFDQKRIKL